MKKIVPETLYDFRFVSAPVFSPDGRRAAFLVKAADERKNGYRGDVWLWEDDKCRRLTNGGDAMSYVWDADGSLLFPAARTQKEREAASSGEERTSFYRIAPDGGEAMQAFTIPARVLKLMPLGEGRYAAHYMHDRAMEALEGLTGEARAEKLAEIVNPPYYQITDYPFWNNGRGVTSGTRGGLGLFDANTGAWQVLCDPEFEVRAAEAGDGWLLYTGAPVTGRRAPYGAEGVFVYELSSGESKCILQPGEMDLGLAQPWGDQVLLTLANPVEWGAGRYADFWLADRHTGERRLLAAYEASVGHGGVGSDARFGGGCGAKAVGERFYFLTVLEDGAYLRWLDRSGTISGPLTPDGSCDGFDVSGEDILTCGMYGDRLSELYLNGHRITDFGDTSGYAISRPERCDIVSDGWDIHGWVMKPVGYERGCKYPAILNIHGGPRTVFGDVFFHEMQVWTNAGYFVFFCNPRGSDGRGNEFGDISGRYGTIDYDDLMAFTDAVLERFGGIDEKRVGVTGGSYGGYMTNWIVGHTNRFAAAASQRSITNWVTYEYTSDIGLDFVKMDLRANTDENLPLMWAQSPLPFAKNCVTPILFIHSDHDHRCWMSEGLTMFTAVKKAGCDAKLCLFRDENHELSRSGRPKNRISRMQEILGWMDKYLK